jgi:hypothetical protein
VKTIRISELAPEGFLSFDLRDILSECSEYESRRWIVWLVEWQGYNDCEEKEPGFFTKHCIEPLDVSVERMVGMTFKELWACAQCVHQTEDGLYLSLRPEVTTRPQLRTLADCERVADLVISPFDFTFWEVTTDDQELLKRLSSKFSQVTMHDIMMEGGSGIPRE